MVGCHNRRGDSYNGRGTAGDRAGEAAARSPEAEVRSPEEAVRNPAEVVAVHGPAVVAGGLAVVGRSPAVVVAQHDREVAVVSPAVGLAGAPQVGVHPPREAGEAAARVARLVGPRSLGRASSQQRSKQGR